MLAVDAGADADHRGCVALQDGHVVQGAAAAIDPAALAAQAPYSTPQVIGGNYWSPAETLGQILASGNPDGLEWSLFGNQDGGYSANMGLDEEDYGVSSDAADKAAGIQDKLSFLPDYAFKGSDSAAGTSTSGIVGMILVAGVILVVACVPKLVKKEKVESDSKQSE